ncbi:MAG: hypothetical protein AYK23_04080 [Candidatus Proteinoplasmatales archaeon SG8-5]|nr:MAG: hypothetical protein AYK23_04080 [Candidatus Proteinoplasmatales archaeon SG8-5]
MQKKKQTEEESAELRHRNLIEKRNELNTQAREIADSRDTLNQERREILDEMRALRDERKALVDKMREHKKARNLYQQRAKELIEVKRGKRKDIHPGLEKELEALKADLKMLDVQQQTSTMTLQEENELLDRMKARAKELDRLENIMAEQDAIISEVEDVNESISELFKMADEEHKKVVVYSDQAQEIHDRITLIIKSVSHLVTEANKHHETFVKLKERADGYHQKAAEMREKLMAIRNIKRDEVRETRKMIREQNKAVKRALDDDKKRDEAADEALETLLKKGKVEIK